MSGLYFSIDITLLVFSDLKQIIDSGTLNPKAPAVMSTTKQIIKNLSFKPTTI